MRNLLLLLLILFSLTLQAQDTIPELITDRPDQTESSAVVPFRFLQIESGFVMGNDITDDADQKSFAYNTTLLRYGLLENFELRLGIEYLGDKISLKKRDKTYTYSGFSTLYTGFKVSIVDENGWKPAVAFLGGLSLPFTAGEDYKPDYTAVNIRFAFSHTLSDRFSIGYNLGAEWDGDTAIPGYFYSLALGMGLTDKLGMFVEGFGLITEDGDSEHLLDAGFTYLVLSNFQLDVSGGIGLNDNAMDNYISAGFTFRIPR